MLCFDCGLDKTGLIRVESLYKASLELVERISVICTNESGELEMLKTNVLSVS